ncbi:hydrolase [Dictyobacter alpinus]|uniref:Hydrolase n=1 Tax=Dictyobacter alpinus TaxID=2014873 RepID=A0A402BDQ4_9CHLR|nr:alpha/beta hydrolase [Dictyobacter alpinus]GCE29436.1 hydrolase [Dictyobacter alpinus]
MQHTESNVKFIPVPGGTLAYEIAGQGPPVLCLPSMGDTRREFERSAPLLIEAGYRVITTDLRGMGQSRGNFAAYTIQALSADIEAILEAEHIERVFLVSCSISAASAGLFALEHPDRVLGLVMISPMVYTAPNMLVPILLATSLRVPVLGRVIWASYFKSLYPLHPVEPDYLEGLRTNLKQPGSMKSVAGMLLAPRLDERLAQMNVPTLAYFCTKDPDFTNEQGVRETATKLQHQIPAAEVVILDDLGHYPHREAPERIMPKMVSWLRALSGSPAVNEPTI